MDTRTALFNGLTLVGLAMQVAIQVRMYKSDLRRELRMFFAYVVFSAFQSIGLFAVRNQFGYHSWQYFDCYWISFVIDTTLVFFIIQEVYAKVLYRYEGLRALSEAIFRWAFMILVIVAGMIALTSTAADRDPLFSGILIFDRSAMMVEVGMMVLLFVFAKSLSLGWRECTFGIAVGMCFYCSVELVVTSLFARYGDAIRDFYSVAKPIAAVTTLAIWTAYVYRSERARSESGALINPALDGWNRAVLQFLHR